MTASPTRAIPRPSERHARRAGNDLVILHDAPERAAKTRVSTGGRAEDASRSSFLVLGWVGALGAAVAFGVLGLTDRADTTLGLLVVPPLAALMHIALTRGLKETHGQWLVGLLFAGFGLRLVAAVPRLLSGADSPVYQLAGERIAESLRGFDFAVATGRGIPGTGSVRYFSGIVNVFTGSNFISAYLVFVTIAFVGQVFLLLGVRRALSEGQFRLAALLVVFSPTMAYWPSSMGKESLSLFGIGLSLYGASRLYDRAWSGIFPALFGLFSVGMVRPHVAMVVLAGVLVGLLARRSHTRGRLATHSLVLVIVVLGSMWVADVSADLFGLESLDGFSDVSAALDFTQERTSQDNAEFTSARVRTVADYPMAAITVLFRPFPWEVSVGLPLLSAIEGSVLLVLVLLALPGALTHVGQVMQRGQLLFAGAFTTVFIYLFSAIGNFGILTRQRSQVIPFVMIFIAFGIRSSRRRTGRVRRA